MVAHDLTQTDDAPTVSEFIPAADAPVTRDDERQNMVRTLQATGSGGLERVANEPYDDTVLNHVYVCDECGDSFPTEPAAADHLQYKHVQVEQ